MSMSAFQMLLDPAILFFFLGCFIALVKSNLEIPPAIARFFSLYLLMAMGFKGGVALSTSSLSWTMIGTLLAAMGSAVIIPFIAYAYLRKRYSTFDAAAIAAAYGSVSAVTFITATQFLERQGVPFSGHMMVAMVLMETPAIIMAIFLAHLARRNSSDSEKFATPREVLREALTDGNQLLLLGSLLIGFVVGVEGKKIMDPFTGEIFKGILAFFLLEMGLMVVRKGRELNQGFRQLIGFGLIMPLISASLAAGCTFVLGLDVGDSLLLIVLSASASYIVVPAVLRTAIPEANPSLYFGSALVITFPFNILIGIPLYYSVLTQLHSL